ncbi:Alkene reductase [Balamuthia mandrillaris]
MKQAAASSASQQAGKRALFSPLKFGALTAKNRVWMSPMTRNRGVVPGPLQQTYYQQRASAGLIISEGTFISPQGTEWPQAPGIYSEDQVKGWKKVLDAVHKKDGLMVCQLWHVGRLTHPSEQAGKQPIGNVVWPYSFFSCVAFCASVAFMLRFVASSHLIGSVFSHTGPSAIAATGGRIWRENGPVDSPYVTPKEMTEQDIQENIQTWKKAAKNAKEAGFDGVEVHGAYGYLPAQFLHDGSNQRKDAYGGSIQNRCRFLLEVIEAVSSVWGSDRVGLKLSPSNTYNDMKDSDRLALNVHLLKELSKADLAYVAVMEPSPMDIKFGAVPVPVKELRTHYKGTLVANVGYTQETASKALENGEADAVSFGQPFVANPDLPHRFQKGLPLNAVDYSTLYIGGEKGYTDYPFAS